MAEKVLVQVNIHQKRAKTGGMSYLLGLLLSHLNSLNR